MRMEQLTVGWDDPTQVNWGETEPEPPAPETAEPPAAPLYKCTALYSYTVSNVNSRIISEVKYNIMFNPCYFILKGSKPR